jgi:GWxTD domain-containing protein
MSPKTWTVMLLSVLSSVLLLSQGYLSAREEARSTPRTASAETQGAAGGPAGIPRPDAASLDDWPDGPVRYILSGPETRLYRSLGSGSERKAFIQQFWSRRDPNVDSLENEYRFSFWRRVAEANYHFTRSTEPGWKTDRGRFHILLGPPDELEIDNMPNQRSDVTISTPNQPGGRIARTFGADEPGQTYHGVERWIYRARPGRRLPPHFILAFKLMPSGDYELSQDSRDWTLFQGMYSEAVRPLPSADNIGSPTDPGPNHDLMELYHEVAMALDLGLLSQAPAPEDLLGELVTSEEFFGRIPFLLKTDFYKTSGAATLAVFTVGVQASSFGPQATPDPGSLLVVGRLESVEDPSRVLLLTGDEALVPAPDGTPGEVLLFQAVKALPAGSYNASFGILGPDRSTVGSYRERVSVPLFAGNGLSLSSLALARSLEPLQGPAPQASVAAGPFRLGNYSVVPHTEASLQNGDQFSIYYQIYGAANDPATAHPRLQLTYRFFVLQDGEFVAIGKPIRYRERTRSVQGWSFPLINWPQETFRLEVTVEDLVSGEVAVGQTVFGIHDDSQDPS